MDSNQLASLKFYWKYKCACCSRSISCFKISVFYYGYNATYWYFLKALVALNSGLNDFLLLVWEKNFKGYQLKNPRSEQTYTIRYQLYIHTYLKALLIDFLMHKKFIMTSGIREIRKRFVTWNCVFFGAHFSIWKIHGWGLVAYVYNPSEAG
jgi:hypothetical protein